MILVYMLLVIAGFFPFAVVLYKKAKQDQLKKHGVKATATVLSAPGSSHNTMHKALIEYPESGTGKYIRKKIDVAGLPYRVGDQLPMYYDRQNPQYMLLDAGKNFIFLLIFTGIIAIFFLVVCFLIYSGIQAGEF